MYSVDEARRGRKRDEGNFFGVASCTGVEELVGTCRFPVGPRHMAGSVRDCVEFRGNVIRLPRRMYRILFCGVC